MSAKMAQSGIVPNAPSLAMSAHDGGLDASAQADDRQGPGRTHQSSTSLASSEGGSLSVGGSLSLEAYLTNREKRQRSRSLGVGAGVGGDPDHPDVRGVPAECLRLILIILISHIALSCRFRRASKPFPGTQTPFAHPTGVFGSHWPLAQYLYVRASAPTPVLTFQCERSYIRTSCLLGVAAPSARSRRARRSRRRGTAWPSDGHAGASGLHRRQQRLQ